jgi:hypothetical protein
VDACLDPAADHIKGFDCPLKVSHNLVMSAFQQLRLFSAIVFSDMGILVGEIRYTWFNNEALLPGLSPLDI